MSEMDDGAWGAVGGTPLGRFASDSFFFAYGAKAQIGEMSKYLGILRLDLKNEDTRKIPGEGPTNSQLGYLSESRAF